MNDPNFFFLLKSMTMKYCFYLKFFPLELKMNLEGPDKKQLKLYDINAHCQRDFAASMHEAMHKFLFF